MKKLNLLLLGCFLAPSTLMAQELKEGYISWGFESQEFPNRLRNWSKTNPKIKNAEQYETRMDVEGLVERAVAGIMITEITPQAEKDAVDELIEDLL